ncbi:MULTISPECIES: hypothetical protein [unclassified Gordonia (in: high G+C Gram-positive bacteria)]|uniref:hypothetical protein n=1 Tax=unclassified Gordonia (in: high G+C Gram-positive bacteria) TaxID=2657482 RepID=UPI0010F73757|nr:MULTISPECIES: hypothetical protein [unclassified Gordonia (in: high G+C Gram-positive bacteria)]
MGLWESVMDFGGGRLDGEMTSSGSGARIRAGVKDLPVVGDVNLVDVQVPGFANGGVVGQASAEDPRAKLAALQARARRRRPGGRASAPTRGSSSSPRPAAPTHQRGSGGHGIGAGLLLTPGIGMGGPGGQGLRKKHECAPGIPCPSCAAGFTIPVL